MSMLKGVWAGGVVVATLSLPGQKARHVGIDLVSGSGVLSIAEAA